MWVLRRTFDRLQDFICWRVVNWVMRRHHMRWKALSRRLRGPKGWRPIVLEGIELQPPRLGQRDPLPISGQPHPLALDGSSHHAHGMTSWRAGCGESRTSGSAGGLGKRTPSDRDTAPQVDATNTGGPQPRAAHCPVKFDEPVPSIRHRSINCTEAAAFSPSEAAPSTASIDVQRLSGFAKVPRPRSTLTTRWASRVLTASRTVIRRTVPGLGPEAGDPALSTRTPTRDAMSSNAASTGSSCGAASLPAATRPPVATSPVSPSLIRSLVRSFRPRRRWFPCKGRPRRSCHRGSAPSSPRARGRGR